MLWVKLGTHIIDHPRFLNLGAAARDLWVWGMLYSGAHELDGALPMVAVITSTWGRGGRANAKLAQSLIEAGLWLRTDFGYLILRWSEQGNATKAELASDREATRVRVARHRNGVTNGVSNAFVPTSPSLSTSSESRSREPEQEEIASVPPEPATGVRLTASDPSPAWFEGACDAAAMAIGGAVDERPARWAEYVASRDRKGWAQNHGDAVGWLTAVVRSERAKARASPSRAVPRQALGSAADAPWMNPTENFDFGAGRK